MPGPVALHGDMHHFNVLRAGREPWLAIDPKGLAGDPCFDVCQFLRNPEPVPLSVNRARSTSSAPNWGWSGPVPGTGAS